jgi:hypothetical protein
MMQSRGDSSVEEYPLFPRGDGGSIPTSPLHFFVEKINHVTAKRWIEKWHYSKKIPTGKNVSFGLYRKYWQIWRGLPRKEIDLYATITYGIGVNPYQAGFLGVEKVVEIKRMCRSEPRFDEFPLSKLISISLKMLLKEGSFDCVVAFADPEQGHEGIVYKASGFQLHGMTNPEWHLEDKDGLRFHRRVAYRHARRNGCSIGESRAILGFKRAKTLPKYRWIRVLKTRNGSMGNPVEGLTRPTGVVGVIDA